MLLTIAAVFLGGVLGTSLRLGLDLALPAGGPLALSTLVANVLGSFILGLVTGRVLSRPERPEWLRAGLGAGLLGSFTSFSALAMDAGGHLLAGRLLEAGAELGLSVVLGIAAALGGLVLGSLGQSRGAS